ncbi:MAG TPA: hypothetical protein PKV67_01065 [Hyphomonas sp.]|nr:hypothetical protein [Hyphomonas sp.]
MATGTESLWQKSKFKIETLILGATTVTATGSELNILSGVTATAAEINAAADVSGRVVTIANATTYSVLAANSGKLHVIPDLTSSCTLSLPTASAGLEYTFIGKGVAADGQNWVINTGSDTNFFLGGVVHLDANAGTGADEIVPIAGDGNSNSKMTVVTPGVGTRVNVFCDGTNWILSGFVVSDTVPSFADQ